MPLHERAQLIHADHDAVELPRLRDQPDELGQQAAHLYSNVLYLPQLDEPAFQGSHRARLPLACRRRPVGEQVPRQRPRAELLGSRAQRHHLRPRQTHPAFAGVNDALRRGKEVGLELLGVGEKLVVSVGVLTSDVLDDAENRAIADDALPLLHLDGLEAAQLRAPGFLDGHSRRVVQAVRVAQILADENDRVASQVLRQVER
jgi:hypothetical protein